MLNVKEIMIKIIDILLYHVVVKMVTMKKKISLVKHVQVSAILVIVKLIVLLVMLV